MQMYRPTERDEDSASEGDANCEDGDYLPGAGAESYTEDHVFEESEESEDVASSSCTSLGESLAETLVRRRLDNAAQLRRPIVDAIQLLRLDSAWRSGNRN